MDKDFNNDFDDEDFPESLVNYDGFINFILLVKYIQLFEIYDKNNDNTEEEFIEVINDYPFLLEENSSLYYKNYKRVYASYIEIGEKEYNEIVPPLMDDVGLDTTKKIPDRYLQILISNENNILYIFLMIKIKGKRSRKKKTIEDFNTELNKALNDENYELAAKLRDKIKKIKK